MVNNNFSIDLVIEVSTLSNMFHTIYQMKVPIKLAFGKASNSKNLID